MKAIVVITLIALLGGAQCFRIRRQVADDAPEADAASEAEADASAAEADASAAEADASAAEPTPKTAGMNVALDMMVDELEKEQSLGGPVNPAGLQNAVTLATQIKMMGGDVSKPADDKLSSLVGGFALQAAGPVSFGSYAAKPADTKVNLSKFA